MAAHVRTRLPVAAWLRGARTGAFFRAARALFADVRGRQHAGGLSDHAGQLFPRAAPTASSRNPQTPDHDDAEVVASAQARDLAARRTRPGNDVPPYPLR